MSNVFVDKTKIEEGIETAGAVTILTDTNGTLNKTVNEIAQLFSENIIPVIFVDNGYPNSNSVIGINFILSIYSYENDGFVVVTSQNTYYEANTINDYPALSQNIITDNS